MGKKYYTRFRYPDPGDTGLVGETTNAPEAIGDVTLSFANLEEQLAVSIGFLLRRGETIGRIVAAELSFRNKLNLFSSIFRAERPKSDILFMLEDLIGVCKEAEQLRNQVVHSFVAEQHQRQRLDAAQIYRQDGNRLQRARGEFDAATDQEHCVPLHVSLA